MSNTEQAPEPTMDEILSSIRRIISDEPTKEEIDEKPSRVASDIAKALSGDESDSNGNDMDDDILELTDIVPSQSESNPQAQAVDGMPDLPQEAQQANDPVSENNELLDSLSRDINNIQNTLNGQLGHEDAQAAGQDAAPMEASVEQDNPLEALTEALSLDNEISAEPEMASAALDIADAEPQMPEAGGILADSSAEQDVSLETALSDTLNAGLQQVASEPDVSVADTQTEEQPQESAPEQVISEDSISNIAQALSEQQELGNGDEVTFGELSPEDQLDTMLLGGDDEQKPVEAENVQQAPEEPVLSEVKQEDSSDQQVDDVSETVLTQSLSAEEVPQEILDDPITPEEQDTTEQPQALVPEEEKPQQAVEEKSVADVLVSELEPKVTEAIPVQTATNNSLEDSIKDMLKPMLRQWLDENMPRLLEGAIKEQAKLEDKSD